MYIEGAHATTVDVDGCSAGGAEEAGRTEVTKPDVVDGVTTAAAAAAGALPFRQDAAPGRACCTFLFRFRFFP